MSQSFLELFRNLPKPIGSPWILAPILYVGAECFVGWRERLGTYSRNATLASLGCWLFRGLAKLVATPLLVFSYDACFKSSVLTGVPIALTWFIAFMWYSFGSYWIHRWEHENAFLWAIHRVHHQSTDFNGLVAFRNSVLADFVEWPIVLSLSILGIPGAVAASVLALVGAYSVLLHSATAWKLGPLAGVLFSSSTHRLHHGMNHNYLNKNFGNCLCLWDKCFGTFVVETEPAKIGSLVPFSSANPFWANLEPWFLYLKRFGRAV